MEINSKDQHGEDGTILPPKDAPVDGADFSVAQKLRFHMTHDLEEHILNAKSEAQVLLSFLLSCFLFLPFNFILNRLLLTTWTFTCSNPSGAKNTRKKFV